MKEKKEGTVQLIECITTWQGEGPDVGKRMLITRFKTCNKKCRWCDTIVKMRSFQAADFTIEQLQKVIDDQKLGIMITGGEPTFHTNLQQSIMLLNLLDYPIANVETNGFNLAELTSKVPLSKPVKFIYSPKIFSEEDLENEKKNVLIFKDDPRIYFKIVFENNELINEYLSYLCLFEDLIRLQRIYLMPEGITRADLLRNAPAVFDAAEKYKMCFSSRTHIIYEFV